MYFTCCILVCGCEFVLAHVGAWVVCIMMVEWTGPLFIARSASGRFVFVEHMRCVPARQGAQMIYRHAVVALVLSMYAPMVVADSRTIDVAHCLRFLKAVSVSAWQTGCCVVLSRRRLSPTVVALRHPILLGLLFG